MAKKEKPLTLKQEGFAQCVAAGDTYADAYRGNYAVKNMSANSIYVESSRLMENPKVALRVKELRERTAVRNEMTLDKVLEQLANWLMFDPVNFIDEETDCVKRLADMDKNTRLCLTDQIQVQELWANEPNLDGKMVRAKIGEIKTVKFMDKRAVSDQFLRKFGAYIADKSDISDNLDAIKELIDSIKK